MCLIASFLTAFCMFWLYSPHSHIHSSFSATIGAPKGCLCTRRNWVRGCGATGLCNAGNPGESSQWDMRFPPSKLGSLPDSKAVQILPLSPGRLHQRNTMGHDALFQERFSGMAKAGPTTPWSTSATSPHCCLSQRSCTPSFSTWPKQRAVSSWVTGEPGQELRTGMHIG